MTINGLNGTTIDFTNASSYMNLDGEELDVYVGLEQESLNDRIDDVFKKDGLFSKNQGDEFNRLSESFGLYYGDWMAGEALKGGAFYSKPMFPHGPNLLQTAAIAASMTGQVWIAVAVSAATSAIQVADGTMSWKQAGFQIAMSAATASLGAGAGKLGDMASVAAGGSKILGAAVTSTVSAAGTTLLSNVTLEGGHIGVDEDKLTNWRTWAGAGVTAAAGTIANGYMQSDMSRGLVNGTGSGISGGITTGDWKESMTNGLRGAAAGYLAGRLGGAIGQTTGISGGALNNVLNTGMSKMLGSDEDFTWASIAQNNAIGDAIGGYLNDALMSDQLKAEIKAKQQADATKGETNSQKAGLMDRLEEAVGGMYLSMKNDFSGMVSDAGRAVGDIGTGLSYAANIAGGFAESVKNGVKYGEFGTDTDPAVQRAAMQDKFGSMLTEVKESGKWDSIPNEDKVAMFQKLEAEGISLSPEQQADYDTAWSSFQDELIMDAVANGDYSMLKVQAGYPTVTENATKSVMMNGKEMNVDADGVNNGGKRINQNGISLHGGENACVFLATYISSGVVSDENLTSYTDTYNKSDGNSVNDGKISMNVTSYQGVKNNTGATDVTIDERGTWVDENPGKVATDKVVDNASATQDMINVLDDGGAIVARVTGHSVTFNGYEIQGDKIIFTVIDTGKNNNTFYDPERKQMYKMFQGERTYDRAKGQYRYLQNYRRVQKKY